MPNEIPLKSTSEVLEKFKASILSIDPVLFCESNLTLDGKPFRLRGNGYKPFIDMYRYVGLKALEKGAKPVVFVKGRQVGATTLAVNLEMYWMACGIFGVNGKSPMRIMHAFPQLDVTAAFAKTKLNPTITQSKQVVIKNGKTKGFMQTQQNPSVEDSLYYKEFMNGNHIWVDSIGVDGSRVRGRTVDCMFYDEVQDMFKEAIMVSKQILKKSQYGPRGEGVQIYMGTPKSKDSMYYEIWMKSTQNYYFLGCENCKEYFPLYTPGSDLWETIWLENFTQYCPCCEKEAFEDQVKGFQVQCTKCGHVQDKREAAEKGKWIGKNENDPKCEYVGFHINQLYMPEFDRNSIIKQKPGHSVVTDERTWQNEVLGEFYTGQGISITTDEIKSKCSDFDRRMRKIILPNECENDHAVYLGADWGKMVDGSFAQKGEKKTDGPKGQSYSCVVILKVEGPKLFSIQFATKLKENSLSYKMEFLEDAMLRYNVKLAVGDIGFGFDLMQELHNKFGDKFLASNGLSDVHGKMKFQEKDTPPTIMFEKDHLIEEMFGLLRAGAIRFPMKSWEDISWLVQHCASMIVKPTMNKGGDVRIRYAKGPIPNDGLMALINAYLAYKFDITRGFKAMKNAYGNNVENLSQTNVGACGIYLPGMRLTM